MRITAVCGYPVKEVVEVWRLVDRWWTDSPINRTYAEVDLENGKRVVVMREGDMPWHFITEANE